MRAHWFARTLATMLLVVTALDAARPMVAYRALAIGATHLQVGLIAAAYAAFSVLMAIPIGRRVDRYGEAPFVVGGAAVIAVTLIGFAYTDAVLGLMILHALLGVGQMLAVVGLQSLVTTGASADIFDGRFGMFAAIASIGQIAGPMVGGFFGGMSGVGVTGVFFVACGIALAAMVLALSLWWLPPPRIVRSRPAPTEPALGIRALLRRNGMAQGMLASLTVLASIDILIAYMPAYGQQHNLPVATVGVLLAIRAATSTAARLLMLPLIRLLGRRRLLAMSMLVSAGALGVLPLSGSRVHLLALLLAVSGVGLGLAQPMTMSWIAATAPRSGRATALSVRITGNRLGQFMLPAAVGVIAGAAGVSGIFVAVGVVVATSGLGVMRTDFAVHAAPPARLGGTPEGP